MVGDASLPQVSSGDLVDLVVRCLAQDQAVALWHQELCRLEQGPLGAVPGEVWTLYGVRVQHDDSGLPILEVVSQTKAFRRPSRDLGAFYRMSEVCAGIGGIAMGHAASGGSTLVFVDRAAIACETLQLNHGRVIQGDLAEREVRIRFHEATAEVSSMLAAGIPCQGYSRQGQGKGVLDPRSTTALHVLQCAWHVQSSGVILECVAEILSHPQAISWLMDFAARAGFQYRHVTLDLADQWASKRLRWWAVMVPADMPAFELRAWPPVCPTVLVQDVIPEWPIFPPAEEEVLLWTEQEIAAYGDPDLGSEPRLLDAASKCPTALHSWGNALRACPCQCRSSGFSEIRSRTQGLRGFGVPASSIAGTRFLHPQEAGLLNTVPVDYRHLEDLRAGLCLVGQLAAPLQSLWVCSQVHAWASAFFERPFRMPEECLATFKAHLLLSRDLHWQVPSMLSGGRLQVQDSHSRREIHCSGPVQAGQLLRAEAAFLAPGFRCELHFAGVVLAPEHFLQFGRGHVYELKVMPKRQAKAPPAATSRGSWMRLFFVPLGFCSRLALPLRFFLCHHLLHHRPVSCCSPLLSSYPLHSLRSRVGF